MNEVNFKLPSIFDSGYHVLTLTRGRERRESHFQIVIETLRVLYPQMPTRDQLQKTVRIRRTRFIKVLQYLVDTGTVVKVGTGTKRDAFRYRLADGYLQK
jgi:hypothetical protein